MQAQGLSVHGAFSTESGCEIRGDASILGSLKTEGPCVVEGAAEVTGTLKTEDAFRGKRVRVSGVLKAEAGMRGEEFEVSGVLKAEGDVQAERFRASGPVTVEGELNAETVELQLEGAIKSSTITTLSPGLMASLCISITALPYSRSYSLLITSLGSLPCFLTGTNALPKL